MQLTLSWLKEFIEISLPAESLARELTQAGIEVTQTRRLEGLPAARLPSGQGQAGDWLFTLEVTPNRPDLLSHLGLAREVAAILARPFRIRKGFAKKLQPLPWAQTLFSIEIQATEDCRLYVGILLSGIQVKESPPEILARLKTLGMKPVNNVVDVTNLCLLELGQPLHAFDADRISGEKVLVRRALPAEALIAIDGTRCTLTPNQLVIADGRQPVALAGVMGGRDTEVSSSTKRILLESAWFDPIRVRRGRIEAKLESESSYRFERGVDPAMVPMAAYRAARLILECAGGTHSGGPIQVGEIAAGSRTIRLVPRRAQEILGMPISARRQKQTLERLGCEVTGNSRGWRVAPPSWRADLKIPEDLYEELARLWGYERCAATLPPSPRRTVDSAASNFKKDLGFVRQMEIRKFLAACGLQEIMTYSLVHPEDYARIGMLGGEPLGGGTTLPLKNPISVEHAVLRRTLLIGALKTLALNLHRKSGSSFELFELGRVYQNKLTQGELVPSESRRLALLAAGTPTPTWREKRPPRDLFHLKGVIRELFSRFGAGGVQTMTEEGAPVPYLANPALAFRADEKLIGWAGAVSPQVLASFEIPEGIAVSYAELDLELLFERASQTTRVEPLPKVPPVARDLAVLVGEEATYAELHHTMEEAGKPLLQSVELFDLYKGAQVPQGKKSLAFRLLFSEGDRTLREEEINAALQKIIERLQKQLQATIR